MAVLDRIVMDVVETDFQILLFQRRVLPETSLPDFGVGCSSPGYPNRRIITPLACPCGVTLKLMKLSPGGVSPSVTAATGHSGSGV